MKRMKQIAWLLILCTALCVLAGCSPKTPQTVDGFTAVMEDHDFKVEDITASTETDDLATAVIVAYNDEFQVEFWELNDDETGEGVFYVTKETLDEEHSVKSMSTEIAVSNHNYYAFTADGNFYMISRVGHTMLYCEAESDQKSDVVALAEELGYK